MKKPKLKLGKLDFKIKNKNRKESRTPRVKQNFSKESSLDISNHMNKTYNENDYSIFDIKFSKKKFQGPKTELNQVSSIEHITDQFALKEYTEKQFQVMCAIVDKTKEDVNKALDELNQKVSNLAPIFNLMSNFEISKEKSILDYITNNVYI